MRTAWTLLAGLLAVALASAQDCRAGQVLFTDGSSVQGIVTLVAGNDNISVQLAGKPAQFYKLSAVKTAIFDSLAGADNGAPVDDYVPWVRAEVSTVKRPRIAQIKGNAITIKDGSDAFQLGKNERAAQAVVGEDRCFVFQKLEWDGEIVARLLPTESAAGTHAGLMICESTDDDAPRAIISRNAESPTPATFTFRPAHGEEDTAVPQPVVVNSANTWLKLRRTWDTIRAYESPDGIVWTTVGECRVEMDDKKGVYIGVTAEGSGSAMLAAFDNIRVSGRRTAAVLPGAADPRLPDVLVGLHDGSVFAGLLQTIAAGKGDATIKKVGGDTITVPAAAVARAQFGPMGREDVDKFTTATAGALTRDGDFLEGEIKEVKHNEITVSSVTFGLTTMERRRVTALVFKPSPPPEPRLIEVRLQDGSLMLGRSLAVEKDQVILDEPLLGTLKYPTRDVISIDRR